MRLMKQIFAIAVVFLLFTGATSAQHFNIGIKGGLNAYSITEKSVFDETLKAGLHVGLIGHIHLSNNFALQPELVYSMQGSKSIDLNYVNVPLLFQYMFDNGFRLQAGPQLGFLVSAEDKNNVNIKNNFESLDIAIAMGISYVNPATNFGVDFRYNHGLTDVSKNNGPKIFNRGFQLGVFYLFNHK